MADIEIVRETTDGFTHQGHSVSSTDSYIKVRRSFRQHALRLLRGAPISCFWEIALADDPPDVQTICANTGYTSPATVCAALDFLVSRNFIQEIGRDGPNGVKRYRAIGYAWSGSDRDAPQYLVDAPSRITRNEIRQTPAKPKKPRVKSEIRRSQTEIRRVISHDDVPNNDSHEKSLLKHPFMAEIEKILANAFEGINVKRLAERIDDPANAQAWVDWCADPYTKKRYRNPQGAAYKELMQTPNAHPPFSPTKQENAVQQFVPGKITGHLAALTQLPLEDNE